MSNTKISPKGIKGWVFLIVEFFILGCLFFIALRFVAPNIQVSSNTLNSVGEYLTKTGVKFFLAVVISFLEIWVVFKHVLDTKLSELKVKLKEHHNDSYAYIIFGLVTSVVVMLAAVGDATPQYFLYQILTRGTVGFAIATVFTVIFAKVFGMKNMDEFRYWINEKDNNSYAIIVAGISIVSMVLSMNA